MIKCLVAGSFPHTAGHLKAFGDEESVCSSILWRLPDFLFIYSISRTNEGSVVLPHSERLFFFVLNQSSHLPHLDTGGLQAPSS